MRIARLLSIFVSIVGLLFAACSSQTAPGAQAAGGQCVTDFSCPDGFECGAEQCEPIAPSLYPHIQTASAMFRPYLDAGERDYRANNYDLLIARIVNDVDEIRTVNPNVRLFDYINIRYHRYDEVDNRATRWALARGLDPEDFFLHYREDTNVPTWESRVLVSGYPPGVVPGWNPNAGPSDPPASATSRDQSRAFGYNDGVADPWYMAAIENPGFRNFLVDHTGDILDGSLWGVPIASGPIDGVVADNAIYYPAFREGVLDRTSEYYGMAYTDDHPYAHGFESIYPELAAGLAARFGRAIDVMPNYGHVLFLNHDNVAARNVQKTTPWAWGEVWLMYHGYDQPTSGSLRCITWDKDYENAIAAIVRETRQGARRVLGARDTPLGAGTGSDRGRIFLLGLYYLVHNRNTWLLYETVNGHSGGTYLSIWQWNPAVEFDVGQATSVPQGVVDFDGRGGTSEHYIFDEGVDPYRPDLTYRVLARNFSNALVLAKMLPAGSVVSDLSATTHPLGRSYAALEADGTLGPVVTSITLRNNEAAILIPVN